MITFFPCFYDGGIHNRGWRMFCQSVLQDNCFERWHRCWFAAMRESICVHGKLESQGMLSGTRARRNLVRWSIASWQLGFLLYLVICIFVFSTDTLKDVVILKSTCELKTNKKKIRCWFLNFKFPTHSNILFSLVLLTCKDLQGRSSDWRAAAAYASQTINRTFKYLGGF